MGYPRLLAAGRDLLAEGVRFSDLHRVFSNETRSVYEDDCCHLGKLGNDLLADAIFRVIAADLAADH
ncbi:MAG: hypothetical protein LJE84_05585 [Gammaproteobacteria bacterium]|nr:hypothetical protein [Gammaproteobacteria bacterium]